MSTASQKSIFRETSIASSEQLTEGSIELGNGYCYFSMYSTVMVFRPDFSFESKQSDNRSKGPATNGSWLADSDTDGSPLRKSPLTRIEELPLSPKSGACAAVDSTKVCAESNVIKNEPTNHRPKLNNRKPYVPTKKKPLSAVGQFTGPKRLDREDRVLDQSAKNKSMPPSNLEAIAERRDGGEEVRPELLNSKPFLTTFTNSSSTSIKSNSTALPHDGSRDRIFRPKLQLRTTSSVPAATLDSRRPHAASTILTRNKEIHTTPPSTTASRSSLETNSSGRTESTASRRMGSKLPLHSLLLSPLGIRRKNHASTNTSSIFSKVSNNTDVVGQSNNIPSAPQTPLGETIDEEKDEIAELSDMVTTENFGARDPSGGGGVPRPQSRFRRFSLAYLSGSDHEYDGGSEQSSKSPLRSWRSWSNRSSIVSSSSANNRSGRTRSSSASISTSHGSSSSASSSLDNPNHPESVQSNVDHRHRPSISGSSVAELPWRQVQSQTYAHLMSSRRNSVVTTTTTTTTTTHPWQYSHSLNPFPMPSKVPSSGLSATPSQSDTSSVLSLVERVYTTQTPAAEKEDPFTAFYMATKPKSLSHQTSINGSIRSHRRQKKEESFAQQIQSGGFYDSSDDEDSIEEEQEEEFENEDLIGYSDSHDWWLSGIEESTEDEWNIHRVPSLEFDPLGRDSSVSTNTTLATDEICPSTPTPSEIADYRRVTEMTMSGIPAERQRRCRRRTASSECLIIDAVEGLRTMYLDETPDECAVEEEDETTYFTERSSNKTNTISSKSPSEAGTIKYQRIQPLGLPPNAQRTIR